jgi:hypothetical protein
MAVNDDEVESLRFHLGYGQVGTGAYPYTPDGFHELFHQVIQPNLTTGAATTASTSATAGVSSVTVASLTDIAAQTRLVVDVGDAVEVVVVRSTSGSAFTATFAADHAAPFPVAVMSGEARLRLLLHRADATWQAMQAGDISDTAGIKRIEGDLEYFANAELLKVRQKSYRRVVEELSRLVRVAPADCGPTGQLEAY